MVERLDDVLVLLDVARRVAVGQVELAGAGEVGGPVDRQLGRRILELTGAADIRRARIDRPGDDEDTERERDEREMRER